MGSGVRRSPLSHLGTLRYEKKEKKRKETKKKENQAK
jgi:hypothetical protein